MDVAPGVLDVPLVGPAAGGKVLPVVTPIPVKPPWNCDRNAAVEAGTASGDG